MPIHRIVPTILLHGPLQGSAVSAAQAVLSQPSAQEPQPQPLPLATQLSQILKRTLLKLQYILILASKYPRVSTYSWLFNAILQPPALSLSVLDFLLDPDRRKKNFQALQALL